MEVAGNVGTPVSALAGTANPAALIACETSSFQLEDATAFAPETAVFLNFSEDHLDRHATLDEYLAAKLRVFAHQPETGVAVLNDAEPVLRGAPWAGRARCGSARTLAASCAYAVRTWNGTAKC